MKSLIFIIILSGLVGTGCSHYYASQSDLNQRIDNWLSDNEYTKIDATLQHLSPSHPDYQRIKSRQASIKARKQNFIKDTLDAVQKMQQQENWQQATDILDAALAKLPDNKQLLKRRNKLIEDRNDQVIQLRKSMLLKRARALIQYKSIYDKLKKLIPDDFSAQYDINQYNREKLQVSSQLMECGKHALAKKHYAQAEECFHLSQELIPSKEKLALLNKTKARRKHIEDENKSRKLINAYQKAFDNEDYPKARYLLKTLIALKPEDQQAKRLKKELDEKINSIMNKGIAEGKKHYSEGDINKAVSIWNELLKIEPENEELISLIARGKKVSKKIENLEKSSAN